jgi:hypothetical protein
MVYVPGCTFIKNLPLLLALEPLVVPLIVMDENGNNSPLSLNTIPNIFCAEAWLQLNSKKSNKKFFIHKFI